jgi:hypothetical protein
MYSFFNLTGEQHKLLEEHLFPGDGKEAIALALCGRSAGAPGFQGLSIHEIFPIPYDACNRSGDNIRWPTAPIWHLVERAIREKMSVVKIHCHPGGEEYFSLVDDRSDTDFYDSVFGWSNGEGYHASLIMLPDGRIFGRMVEPVSDGVAFRKIDRIRAVGENLIFWDYGTGHHDPAGFTLRTRQAFGDYTADLLGKLRVAVIGCSGTGSPLIEQLVRLGIGEIHLIDPDQVEEKNLNRILNTGLKDIGQFKVDVLKNAIEEIGFGTKVFAHPINLFDDLALIRLLGTLDTLLGCTDSVDSRHLLNHIATFYTVPYFDVGVKLMADGQGGIDKICGGIHYLPPGDSLLERNLYDPEDLRAATMLRTSPEAYQENRKSGYIKNVQVENPAVISVNMLHASLLCLEFKARLHPYRYVPNSKYDHTMVDITDWSISHAPVENQARLLKRKTGRGDIAPLLEMPELS